MTVTFFIILCFLNGCTTSIEEQLFLDSRKDVKRISLEKKCLSHCNLHFEGIFRKHDNFSLSGSYELLYFDLDNSASNLNDHIDNLPNMQALNDVDNLTLLYIGSHISRERGKDFFKTLQGCKVEKKAGSSDLLFYPTNDTAAISVNNAFKCKCEQ